MSPRDRLRRVLTMLHGYAVGAMTYNRDHVEKLERERRALMLTLVNEFEVKK